jgi:RNA polymerase primary sigma factor
MVTPDRVREITKASQQAISLDTPVGEEEDRTLVDFIEDTAAMAPAAAATNLLLKAHIAAVLDSVTGRERRLLQLRFGLEDGRARTLEEVGGEFNVTRERIRRSRRRRSASSATHPVRASCGTSWRSRPAAEPQSPC